MNRLNLPILCKRCTDSTTSRQIGQFMAKLAIYRVLRNIKTMRRDQNSPFPSSFALLFISPLSPPLSPSSQPCRCWLHNWSSCCPVPWFCVELRPWAGFLGCWFAPLSAELIPSQSCNAGKGSRQNPAPSQKTKKKKIIPTRCLPLYPLCCSL